LESIQPVITKQHQIVAWALLGGLLFLRLPFLAGLAVFSAPDWLDTVFQVGTYFLTACLVWWERERLQEFFIDKLALVIIILFKPIQTLISALRGDNNLLAFPQPVGLALWAISLGLVCALWLSHTQLPKISKASWKWFWVGALVGVISILITAYPQSLEISKSELQNRPNLVVLLVQAPIDFIYQLGYAAVTEEPLFRAFLWVYLLQAGWKNVWIWLFQAGLFMLGHIYYMAAYPFLFWLIIPFGGLILGGLAWRSKTISSSLAAHAAMNALGYGVAYFVAYFGK
jgi:hypothetical protein